jgi:hypothetical protein
MWKVTRQLIRTDDWVGHGLIHIPFTLFIDVPDSVPVCIKPIHIRYMTLYLEILGDCKVLKFIPWDRQADGPGIKNI